MISCAERADIRERTIRNLEATDWGQGLAFVQIDRAESQDKKERQVQTALLALKRALEVPSDYVLFLEDDLEFNRHLRHNLERWLPLRQGGLTLGGLYNPGLRELACSVAHHFSVVAPDAIFGSQAFLISRVALQFIVRHWREITGLQDIRISRLAGRLGRPIFYHSPSLVEHIGLQSVWGGRFHRASDFDSNWRARQRGRLGRLNLAGAVAG